MEKANKTGKSCDCESSRRPKKISGAIQLYDLLPLGAQHFLICYLFGASFFSAEGFLDRIANIMETVLIDYFFFTNDSKFLNFRLTNS